MATRAPLDASADGSSPSTITVGSVRMTVRLHAVGSAESAPLVAAIRHDAAEIFGPDIVVQPVGSLWEEAQREANRGD